MALPEYQAIGATEISWPYAIVIPPNCIIERFEDHAEVILAVFDDGQGFRVPFGAPFYGPLQRR